MASAALNFNHRKGKINLYGDYSYIVNDLQQVFRFYRAVDFGGAIKENETFIDRSPVTKDFSGKLGMDIQLSKRTTLGAMVSGYTNYWSMRAAGQTLLSANQQLDTIIRTDIYEIDNWKSFNTNLNIYHVLGKDENLSLNLDYLYFRAENPVAYNNDYFTAANDLLYNTQVKSSKLTPIRFFIGSTDYSRKLGNSIELQAGIKLTFSGFTNDILVTRWQQNTWNTDEDFSANYVLNENIQAGYISVNSNVDARTNVKVGLRYEYTNSQLDTRDKQKLVDRHYGKLFPSLFLSRKLNDQSALNVSYSRRITRPTYNELAPFTIFGDPNSFTTGNPSLQPSIADAVAAGYSYKNYIFSLAYTYDAGAIARLQPKIDPATNKQIISSENMNNLQTLAGTISISVKPAAWWSMQYNIAGQWQESNSMYKDAVIIVVQRSFRMSAVQSFRLPKKFVLEVSGYYQSADLRGRSIRRPFGSLDLGLQKGVGEKGKLSLTGTDLLNTTIAKGYINIPEEKLVFRRTLQFTQRQFKLTWSQGFGNNKLRGKRNRADSAEEERKRVE
jgi:outer membrane receptor protein involved in Fe transport